MNKPSKKVIDDSSCSCIVESCLESTISTTELQDHLEITVQISTPFAGGERDNDREVALYFDLSGTMKHLIAGHPATTFIFGDEILLITETTQYRIRFTLEEGSGDFVGHLSRGSKPSIFPIQGRQRAPLCDWQLFLRTLRRSDSCTIKITLQHLQ